jgi:hypothetical protein
LRSGFLLKVWQDDQWVSGLMTFVDGRERVLALADGLHAPLLSRRRDGAIAANHYFLFQWARENGVGCVNFCGARPHLMDGVFRHKQLWAAESRPDPWHHTQIVFYLDREVALPEVITRQLVDGAEGWVSIGDRL